MIAMTLFTKDTIMCREPYIHIQLLSDVKKQVFNSSRTSISVTNKPIDQTCLTG